MGLRHLGKGMKLGAGSSHFIRVTRHGTDKVWVGRSQFIRVPRHGTDKVWAGLVPPVGAIVEG